MSPTNGSASPGDTGSDRLLFGDEAARWLPGRDRDLLPAPARPAALRRTWLLLAVVLLVLTGLGVGIGADL